MNTEKRYAYRHVREKDVFGLLDATDYNDARRYLPSCYKIKVCHLPVGLPASKEFDSEWKAEFVNNIFNGQTATNSSRLNKKIDTRTEDD